MNSLKNLKHLKRLKLLKPLKHLKHLNSLKHLKHMNSLKHLKPLHSLKHLKHLKPFKHLKQQKQLKRMKHPKRLKHLKHLKSDTCVEMAPTCAALSIYPASAAQHTVRKQSLLPIRSSDEERSPRTIKEAARTARSVAQTAWPTSVSSTLRGSWGFGLDIPPSPVFLLLPVVFCSSLLPSFFCNFSPSLLLPFSARVRQPTFPSIQAVHRMHV